MSHWNGSFFSKTFAAKAAEAAVQTACILSSDAANVRFRAYFKKKINSYPNHYHPPYFFYQIDQKPQENTSPTISPYQPNNSWQR